MKLLNRKNVLRLLVFGIFSWIFLSYIGSRIATKSHPVDIPSAEGYFSQIVENQVVRSEDGLKIAAWFIPSPSKKSVIILSGIGGNRTGLISRAKFYLGKNYNVLLPDLRGTGESEGKVITFGWQERFDLQACVDFLKKRGMNSIAAHGLSLGAATIVYSFQERQNYAFVVLESCYDNISNALKNRVERFPFPKFVYFPMIKFTEWRVGASSKKLSPEDYLDRCTYPIFFMAGDAEKKVKKEETEKLFAKCISKTKQLHFFENAFHEDFMRRFEKEWKEEMRKWLEKMENLE